MKYFTNEKRDTGELQILVKLAKGWRDQAVELHLKAGYKPVTVSVGTQTDRSNDRLGRGNRTVTWQDRRH
jgi:hypothetical protein